MSTIPLLAAFQLPVERRAWWAFDLYAVASAVGSVLVVLLLAWLAFRGLGLLLRRIEASIADQDAAAAIHEQRVRTLLGLLRSVGVAAIVLLSIFMLLAAVGVNIAPLLAGAGVLGLAISFGAQSLVRDVISGLFILLENQIAVGDVIRIGQVAGKVEKMTLRIVVLRDLHGAVHVIPNGEIKQVSNMTRSFTRAVFEVGVAYREDVDRVMQVMREVGAELYEDPEWRPLLISEVTVPGIEGFGESSINIRIMVTTLPLKHTDVARELRRRLKIRFDREGIEMPFPHRTVYWGEGQRPVSESA